MSHAYETVSRAPGIGSGGRLTLNVVFTEEAATRRAIRTAHDLASGLHAEIRLVVAHVVPYPLPLEHPTSSFRMPDLQDDVRASVYLCRDLSLAICAALVPNSVVLIGSQKHWWQRSSNRIARELQKLGHTVILV